MGLAQAPFRFSSLEDEPRHLQIADAFRHCLLSLARLFGCAYVVYTRCDAQETTLCDVVAPGGHLRLGRLSLRREGHPQCTRVECASGRLGASEPCHGWALLPGLCCRLSTGERDCHCRTGPGRPLPDGGHLRRGGRIPLLAVATPALVAGDRTAAVAERTTVGGGVAVGRYTALGDPLLTANYHGSHETVLWTVEMCHLWTHAVITHVDATPCLVPAPLGASQCQPPRATASTWCRPCTACRSSLGSSGVAAPTFFTCGPVDGGRTGTLCSR